MNLRRGIAAALMAGAFLAGCGDDDNGPTDTIGTEFTAEERAALSTAFVNAGLIPDDPEAAQAFGLLLGGITSYGTITIPASLRAGTPGAVRLAKIAGEYDATAVQYLFDVTVNGEPAIQGFFAGIVAWSNLDVQEETIDDYISIGGSSDDPVTNFPETVSGTVPDDVSAEYWVAATNTFYEGISGSASITASNFDGSEVDCSVTVPNIGTLTCSYDYGSQEGAFDFVGAPLFTEGENVTFASTSYQLPAVRVRLGGNLTVPVAQVAAVKSALRKMARVK
jgi:hypothetical protein